jgi:replicative DNA helicase
VSSRKQQTELLPVMPNDVEAERSVLGAVIMENSYYEKLSALKSTDFFQGNHQRIWEVMKLLHEENSPVDLITIVNKLRQEESLEFVGGAAYISQLTDGVPRISNVEHYSLIVRQKSAMRSLLHISRDLEQACFEQTENPQEILERFASQAMKMAAETAIGQEGMTETEAGGEMLSDLDKLKDGSTFTGIKQLDRWTGGFQGDELVCIAAETNSGKSIFARQIQLESCARGFHGHYATGEMKARNLLKRNIFPDAEVPLWKIRQPSKIEAKERARIVDALKYTCGECRFMDKDLSLSKISLAARQAKLKSEKFTHSVGDYDRLIAAPGKDQYEIRERLYHGFKVMATDNDITTFLIASLVKDQNEDEPSLRDIAGKGGTRYDPDWVLYFRKLTKEKAEKLKYDWPLFEHEQLFLLHVLKARNGDAGVMPVIFNKKILLWYDLSETGKGMPDRIYQRNRRELDFDGGRA